jgi:hypothetical protein
MADDMKQAWTDVGERFAALSDVVRRRPAGEGGAAEGRDDEGDTSALHDAFEKVIAAVRDLGDKAATVVKDPEVRSHTKDVAQSLNAALSATVDQIGGEVESLVEKAKRAGRGSS